MNDTTLLLSDAMDRAQGAAIDAIAVDAGARIRRVPLSTVESADADDPRLAAVTAAWYSRDLFAGLGPARPTDGTRRLFAQVDRAPALRWLHVMSAGADFAHYRPSLARGVALTTSAGVTAIPIAQTIVAAVLGHARGFPGWLGAQRRHEWAPRMGADAPADLVGQTAVIVGMGPIGRETARLLRAIGLRTVGVRRQAQPLADVDETLTYDALDSALPGCDWLILCCPLGPLTRGLVDAARLARLPARARVVNVGRGPVVVEPALVDALRDGRVAGAYLDVFEQEPLAADSPLWDLPNVWLSPHNAAASQGNPARDTGLFLDNLRRWVRGDTLRNRVDEPAG